MRIETLRTFLTVSECGTLREAAQQLNRTQSALSMTLKQFEEELGGALFETDRKRDLTDLGEYVRKIASDILRDHDQGIGLIKSYATGKLGRLRISSVPSVAALLLPELVQDFMHSHEGAEIDLMDTDSATVRKSIASGRADLGIASAITGDRSDGFESEFLFSDRLYLVCRSDSGLAKIRGPIEWKQLTDFSLIMNETLSQLQNPEIAQLIENSRLSVRNIMSLLAMVKADAGITILPGLATFALVDGLVSIPIADPSCIRSVCLLSRAGRAPSPLFTAMRNHLRKGLPQLAERYQLIIN